MSGKEAFAHLFLRKSATNATNIPILVPVAPLATRLLQVPSEKIITDPNMLVKGALKIHEFFQPQGLIGYYDPRLDAEALGCLTVIGHQDSKTNILRIEGQLRRSNIKTKRTIKEKPISLKASTMLHEALGCDTAIFAAVSCPVELAETIIGRERMVADFFKENDCFFQQLSAHLIQLIKQYMELKIDVLVVVGCWEFFSNEATAQIYSSFIATAGFVAECYGIPLILYLQGTIEQNEKFKKVINLNVQGIAIDVPAKLNDFDCEVLVKANKIVCLVISEEILHLESKELKNYLENISDRFSGNPIMLSLPWKLSPRIPSLGGHSILRGLFETSL